eukprot:CAMPEP_0179026686 /NCGR_PEP_ID=MMETSP0796-20121207/8644_1 /TAXON_ID=73915 /ORGANISM="Pyrodinium bahamense, Strain pbaha01" /LENGTH=507 /DNA_ID=CAMNT_0020722777 /DNA_START=89 /DNA_END=1612 /DNA_ORIENTATION=-
MWLGLPACMAVAGPPNGDPGCETSKYGEEAGSADWSWVGQGRGSYKVVEQIVWVGEGNGSVDIPQTPGRKRRSLKVRICIGIYYVVLSMTVVCLLAGIGFLVPSVQGMISSTWADDAGRAPRLPAVETDSRNAASLNCRARALSTWSVEKRRWCCNNQRIGCPPFDCTANPPEYGNWSDYERTWCCSHKYRSWCASSTTTKTTWTSTSSAAVLAPKTRGTAADGKAVPLPYDCSNGYSTWRQSWSIAQQRFCCKYGGRGCVQTETTTVLLYDCHKGYSRWKDQWSNGKKSWCCKHRGRGCTHATLFVREETPTLALPAEATTTTAGTTLPPTPATKPPAHLTKRKRLEDMPTSTTTGAQGASMDGSFAPATTTVAAVVQTSSSPALTTLSAAGNLQKAAAGRTSTSGPVTSNEAKVTTQPAASPVPEAVALPTRQNHHGTLAAPKDNTAEVLANVGAPLAKPKVAGTLLNFDCAVGKSGSVRAWSVAKKFWCCEYGHVCRIESRKKL